MTNEIQQLQQLTVGQLIKDLQTLPENAEIFVSVLGAGITIPIVVMSKLTTHDNKEIIVFCIPAENTFNALQKYQENMLKHSNQGDVAN